MDRFVNLHTHSVYSMLDGLIRIPDLLKKIERLEQPAIALTDHGVLYGINPMAVDVQKYKNINFIPGCEVYWVPDATIKDKSERSSENDVSRKHLILLAKDNEGYKRLMKICSWGMVNGFYYRPRVDDSILEKYGTEGLIASSACFVPSDNLDVLTKDGIKNLLDVCTDDYVQSHTGEWRRVINPTTREHEGTFVEINVQGKLPLTVTEDHKFFILTKDQLNNYDKYPAASFANIKFSKSYFQTIYTQNLRQFIPQEIEAKNIQVGDCVISYIDETINDVQTIDIKWIYQEQNEEHLKSYELKVTKELLELIGIFISTGNLNNNNINFSFDTRDLLLQKKVQQYMLDIFGLSPQQYLQSNNIMYLYSSKELYSLFSSWFQLKRGIPDFIKYLPYSKQMYCIKGIFISNLSVIKQLNTRGINIIFKTNSKQLIYDVIHILNRNWINPLVAFKKERVSRATTEYQDNYYLYIKKPIVKYFKQFLLTDCEFTITYEIWRKANHLPFEWNGKKYLKYPVKTINKFHDKKQVYCLNVDTDHSFTICNIKVHNCVAGSIPQYLLKGNYEAAKRKALYYKQLFNGDFYLELMPHKKLQEEVNKGLIQLSKDTGIKLILTTDAHYLNKEDKIAHDILLCTQQKTTLNDPNRWKFEEGFYYIMGREELTEIMLKEHPYIPKDILNDAMDNTVKIAEQCHVEFVFGKHFLPKINPYDELKNDPKLQKEFDVFESRRLKEIANKDNLSIQEVKEKINPSDEYIRFLTIHGYHGMYQQRQLNERHLSLLLYELDVIMSMDFSSYFLILEEIIRWCAQNDIPTGVARGCCFPLSKVNTLLKGLINIDQVQKDDQVLGLDNRYHRVLKTWEYDCDEDLIQIETENNKTIEGLTKDHKVLGLKKEDYVKGKEYTLDDLKWYEIDELNVNDYVIEIN